MTEGLSLREFFRRLHPVRLRENAIDVYKRQPQDILSIIDFAYNKIGGKLLIVLADCIGYYSNKDRCV